MTILLHVAKVTLLSRIIQEIILVYMNGSHINTKVFIREGQKKRVRQGDVVMEAEVVVIGLLASTGRKSHEPMQAPLDAERGKRTDSPLEPPERM